jgi:putative flippase GtrA
VTSANLSKQATGPVEAAGATPIPLPAAGPEASGIPAVEIVLPVFNEQEILEKSVRRLHRFLHKDFPVGARITIADNASTDLTPFIAERLATELDEVSYLRLERKGRGRALREAWSVTRSPVACYMDIDLSTDLNALLPLLAPLLSRHSDLAIGTRLAPSANVTRGPKREFISRSYNRILRTALRARFSDAQCGFKAIRTDAVQPLLPEVRDDGWFFDTELLMLAQRRGLRTHEVPVDWIDDPDSRVDIVSTAWIDLKGVARLLASSRIARFAMVGVLSTIAYALIYLLLRSGIDASSANMIALAITAIGNTAANRRWTFGLKGRERLFRQYAMGAAVYLLTLGLTSGALSALGQIAPNSSRALEVTVLVLASIAATVTRYIALKSFVFAVGFPRAHRPNEGA